MLLHRSRGELDDKSHWRTAEFVIVDAGTGYTESLTNQAVTPVENEAWLYLQRNRSDC